MKARQQTTTSLILSIFEAKMAERVAFARNDRSRRAVLRASRLAIERLSTASQCRESECAFDRIGTKKRRIQTNTRSQTNQWRMVFERPINGWRSCDLTGARKKTCVRYNANSVVSNLAEIWWRWSSTRPLELAPAFGRRSEFEVVKFRDDSSAIPVITRHTAHRSCGGKLILTFHHRCLNCECNPAVLIENAGVTFGDQLREGLNTWTMWRNMFTLMSSCPSSHHASFRVLAMS